MLTPNGPIWPTPKATTKHHVQTIDPHVTSPLGGLVKLINLDNVINFEKVWYLSITEILRLVYNPSTLSPKVVLKRNLFTHFACLLADR